MVKGQKYHILYKTTCTVTGNFYIGVHSTTNLEDEYLGSGTRLWYSLQKHGKESHIREILEFFDTREELMCREREVVNEEMLREEKCMNLKKGGEGGGGCSTIPIETIRDMSRRGKEAIKLLKQNPEWRKKYGESLSRSIKEAVRKHGIYNWTGKKHSSETIQKFRDIRKGHGNGETNSQFGTKWVFNEAEKSCRKAKPEELKDFLAGGWKIGRKMTWK